jgi:catechol 2,3-dioxygenase-like lactoylglutathione lyase family enzyme
VFDHVTIRASDREASVRFYLTVLSAIGVEQTSSTAEFPEWDDFSIAQAEDDARATRGLHIAFATRTRAEVDAFWRAGTAAGHADDGAPGWRTRYGPDYYGGFLLDPDGNSAEAVHTERAPTREGNIDHLWIRVADVAAARDFYRTIGGAAGLRQGADEPDRAQFVGRSASFSLVRGDHVTRNVHNGPPGERSRYHPGYFSAFVLDPDGNNVEVVNHHR